MTQPHFLTRLVRAAAIAAVVGAAALTALPAQAVPPMHMHMHPMGPGPFMHHPFFSHGPFFAQPFFIDPYFDGPYYGPASYCLSDWQVRNELASEGYSAISLYAARGPDIQAHVLLDGRPYLIDFNRCGDFIEHQTPLVR